MKPNMLLLTLGCLCFSWYAVAQTASLPRDMDTHAAKAGATLAAPKKFWPMIGWRFNAVASIGFTPTRLVQSVWSGELGAEKFIDRTFAFTLHTGFTHFSQAGTSYKYTVVDGVPVRTGNEQRAYNVIPVQVGVKIYPGKRLYAAAEAGIGFATHGGNSFVWSPAAGYVISRAWNVGIKYEQYTAYPTTQHLALQAVYSFGGW